ncbi:MAG: four helix bundle protein [Pseudomonadota bacterium]
MTIKNFRELIVWQKGVELTELVYKITKSFPKHEQYCLNQQIRRCAISIPSNIAEGFARKHNKEFKQFLYISLGSLAELETQLEIANKLAYMNNKIYDNIITEVTHEYKMILNLIKKLK